MGTTIDSIDKCDPGDLAFFINKERKVVHVGIIISRHKIIHASGKVRIDKIDKNGEVQDLDRIDYFQKYLGAVKKAIDHGAKVKSYFAWTFMDNFEWALGFEKRFGIVHVDFKTLKRTPKKSYYFFKKLVEQNSIPLDF